MNTNGHAANGTVLDPIRQIELLSEQNLHACYQCGRCTADCPFSLVPSLTMRLLQLGEIEQARQQATTWECASCYTCETNCPKGCSPAKVLRALRSLPPGRFAPAAPAADDGAPHSSAAPPPAPRPSRLGAFRKFVRARLLSAMPGMFRIGAALAPASNWLVKLPGLRLAGHWLFGLHKSRPMPPFAKPTFPAWFRKHTPIGDGRRGAVLLFHDTAMDFNYPHVGIAATELLEKLGFRVELTDSGCCGRPAISKGVDSVAACSARQNIPRLFRQLGAGTNSAPPFIVGCEPSCLLTLRHEYLHLAPELLDQAKVVGERAFLIDEFLGMLHDSGKLDLKWKPAEGRKPVLFHGHCHQKAHAHPERSIRALEIAGYDVEFANAACCGMAGAYGYEKEHYEPSRVAGERALFPTVRARPDAEIVVMGVSCRQQLEHFAGRPVKHLVEALRDAVE